MGVGGSPGGPLPGRGTASCGLAAAGSLRTRGTVGAHQDTTIFCSAHDNAIFASPRPGDGWRESAIPPVLLSLCGASVCDRRPINPGLGDWRSLFTTLAVGADRQCCCRCGRCSSYSLTRCSLFVRFPFSPRLKPSKL